MLFTLFKYFKISIQSTFLFLKFNNSNQYTKFIDFCNKQNDIFIDKFVLLFLNSQVYS